ncbi:hypothetical protein HPB51_009469 [Rhipicephalus microplus]|uniref:Uncharacterized protein n=1 Tax=Rhipicephalus microplus TaxID=6941 RepID=A0A9J6DUA0_RHIMP|nr:hypothetical protein HPB51_009469 [Rhipicephalus microplus]
MTLVGRLVSSRSPASVQRQRNVFMESGVSTMRSDESEGPTKGSGSQLPSHESGAFAKDNAAKSGISSAENVVRPKEAGPSGSLASTAKTVRESETSSTLTPAVGPALLPEQVCKELSYICVIRAQRVTSTNCAIVAKGEHTYAKCNDELFKSTADAIERKTLVAYRKAELYRKDTQRMRAEIKRKRRLLAQLNEMRRSVSLPRVGAGISKKGGSK